MTLNLTYRPFVYYRCNVSFGDMLHSTHGLDYTQNMVVYACPRTNRMVCENGGNCYTGASQINKLKGMFKLILCP